MLSIYGFSADQWRDAKAEMKAVLADRARVRGLMPYSELCGKITSAQLEPHSYALAAMLGEVAAEEDESGRGLLTVIVVHKDGDMQPGPGFFEIAKDRGRNVSDLLVCWNEELSRVHRAWAAS